MERAERACCILARPGSEIYSIYPRPCGCQLFDTSLMTAHGKVQSRTRTQNPVPAAIIKRYEIIKRYGEISSDEEGVMVMSAGISSRSEVMFYVQAEKPTTILLRCEAGSDYFVSLAGEKEASLQISPEDHPRHMMKHFCLDRRGLYQDDSAPSTPPPSTG